jgi:hypothetical protein
VFVFVQLFCSRLLAALAVNGFKQFADEKKTTIEALRRDMHRQVKQQIKYKN